MNLEYLFQFQVNSDPNVPLKNLSPLLREATIADGGKLTEHHQSLKKNLPSSQLSSHGIEKKTVLLLGSGMVAAPLVEHLMNRPDVKIVVGKHVFIYTSKERPSYSYFLT